MTRFILGRLLATVPVMLVVGFVSFALLHLTPGGPASVMLGPDATPAQVQQLSEQLGLDDPFVSQVLDWLGRVARLDLGDSIFLDKPVSAALADRAIPSLQLTVYSLTLAVLIGVPAGVVAAARRGSVLDRAIMLLVSAGTAIPSFVSGILLILLFAVLLRWLPSGGYVEFSTDPVGHVRAMLLPSLAIGLSAACLPARLVRSTMIEVLGEPYITAAVAKGLSPRTVALRHGLRNALLPTITALGLSLGDLLGGVVVVETVFNLPGMGQLVVNSVSRRDYPVIQGVVMAAAFLYIVSNLLVDVLYAYLDPRIRYGAH